MSEVTPGRDSVMLSTSSGSILPSLRRVAGRLGERMVGVTPRHELDGHVCDDVPCLPQAAQHVRPRYGALDTAIDLEKPVRGFENPLFGLIAALRRERGVDPQHGRQPGMILASHARVGRCG